jgi:hypothetical protein
MREIARVAGIFIIFGHALVRDEAEKSESNLVCPPKQVHPKWESRVRLIRGGTHEDVDTDPSAHLRLGRRLERHGDWT